MQITESPLRDNDKTTSMFSNDSRIVQIKLKCVGSEEMGNDNFSVYTCYITFCCICCAVLYAQMQEEISSQCLTSWQFCKKLPFKSSATNIRVELESQKSWNVMSIQHWNWLNHRPFYLSGQDLYKLPIVSLGFPRKEGSWSLVWSGMHNMTLKRVFTISKGETCLSEKREDCFVRLYQQWVYILKV